MKEKPNYQAIAEGVKMTKKTTRQKIATLAIEYYKSIIDAPQNSVVKIDEREVKGY